MSDLSQKIVNYYINNPPFEISDALQPTYIEMLSSILENTLIEYSENVPILSEFTFTTESTDTKIDIYDIIDSNFMTFILFLPKVTLPNFLYKYGIAYNMVADTINTGETSILNYVALSDRAHIIDEWANAKMETIVFDDVYIKVTPSTEYYTLYNRYRLSTEIQKNHQRQFTQLYDINMQVAVYNSNIFASEGGIKSVSLSGLSVSFNVPTSETYQLQLDNKKQKIFDSLIDYNDCVESF